MLTRYGVILFFCWIISAVVVQSQDLPRCSERDFLAEFPRVEPVFYCIEHPVVTESAGEISYTSLQFADDGTLYATYPYRGQVVALRDTDGDDLPDSEELIAEDLRYPNGLALWDDILYVIGDGVIYTITDGTVETLVDDLPGGRGFIAKGITIHEGMLYAGIPSPCDFCEGDDPLHGTVIHMNLDGTEREVVARGLRYPAGLAISGDSLWITDTARDAFGITTAYDEINRVDLSADTVPHFGFPYCVGENLVDLESDFDCSDATVAEVLIRSNSNPIALELYTDDTFPHLENHLMVVLSGSNNSSFIPGHAIFAFDVDEESPEFQLIAPADNGVGSGIPDRSQDVNLILRHSEFVNNQAGGLFPHFVYDIAVSPEGWLYFSVGGKGIFVLRPQT